MVRVLNKVICLAHANFTSVDNAVFETWDVEENVIRTIRAATLTAFVLSAVAVWGQATNSGDIRGTVTDPTGAVVPGVIVSVIDTDKGVTRSYTTNAAGLFDTGSIVTDRYLVTFSKPGFKTLQQGPITLEVGTLGLNAILELGNTTESVVVTTDAPLMETTSAAQAKSFTSKEMQELPQVGMGANWQAFLTLLPGTAGTPEGKNSAVNPGVSGVSANGSEPFSTTLLDGATTSSPQSNNVAVPMIFDALSEVKVSDSLFSAEFGVGGMIYNRISKGGGNRFHGEAYEYFQNDALNAAPYSFGVTAKVPMLRYNEFGGNVGGPIIPHRMFFFFDYDKIIDHGGAANGFITVPNDAMRAGDFTGMPTIYDPTTQTVDSKGVVHRQSFAAEYGNGNKIPTSLIDSVAAAIQAYYPKPNVAGTLVNGIPKNNYFFNVPSSTPEQRWFGRLDYDIASNNRFTASEFWGDRPARTVSEGLCPINCFSSTIENSNSQVSDVWTISAKAINEARLGFTDELDFFVPDTLGKDFPSKLNWNFAKANLFPTVNIGGEYALSPGVNAVYKEFIFDPSDIITLIRGRHVLHFGGEFLIERLDSTAWGNINAGTMNFSGNYTASTQGTASKTGLSYADFLLGQASKWNARVSPEYGARMKAPQVFINDDYQVRPNLTVNLGLRWMGETGWHEVHGNQRSFDPTIMNPATNTPGAMWYAVTHVNGRKSLQHPIWDVLMPRLGVAYEPSRVMTIRGGFGVYTYPWSADTYGGGNGGAFGSSGGENDSTNGVLPVVILSSSGDTNYQAKAGASVNSLYLNSPLAPDSYNRQGAGYTQYDAPAAKLYQWNLSLQQLIGANMVTEIAYVGSHGADQPFSTDLNQVPESMLGPNDASGATNARPYPQYQGIGGYRDIGISHYHSLQASIQKRMSSGISYNFNYTWSKYLNESDSSGQGAYYGVQVFQNAYDPSANYGPSNFDIRNMFKGQGIYELPFGRGRRFLNNGGLMDAVVGGWLSSMTLVAQSGNPFTVVMASNTSYSQAGSQYPNVVGTPQLSNRSPSQWFNVNAFAAPAPATFGNSRRNSLYGPGLLSFNMALSKSFQIERGVSVQFSADATNVINHPSFGLPDANIGPGHNAQITSVTVGGRAMQLVAKVRF